DWTSPVPGWTRLINSSSAGYLVASSAEIFRAQIKKRVLGFKNLYSSTEIFR
ncbi:27643_t:CDS:2, partial [Gigaspora margarita]